MSARPRLLVAVILTVVAGTVFFVRRTSRDQSLMPGAPRVGSHQTEPDRSWLHLNPVPPVIAPPALARSDSTLGQFQVWMQGYFATPGSERAALVAEGVRLARERRVEFKKLIQQNPREALRQAVPSAAAQQLPEEIAALLEQRVSGRGVLRTYLSYPAADAPPQPPVLRYAEFEDGRTYEAHVYGRRAETVTWVTDASLNGVAMDRHLAVDERPLRRLEAGGVVAPGRTVVTVCPVCGKSTGPHQSAVEAFGQIVYLCNELHVAMYEEILIQAEGSTGGPQRFTGILPPGPALCVGQLRVLYIPMTFADQNQVPCTEATCYAIAKEIGDFFYKASYGRLTYLQTVTPPIKLPHDEAWYKQKDYSDGVSKEIDGFGPEHQHAREEARKLGYDDRDYDVVVVRLKGGPRATGGWGGGSSVWVYQDDASLVAHELGHCFGLAHANFWDTGGSSAIGAGGNQEYGNSYDIMGSSLFPWCHHNAKAKNQIRWLADQFIQTVTESGLYRIYALDQSSLDAGKRYALKIIKDNQRTYWGEVRTLFDDVNKWAAHGMLLGWNWPQNGGSNIQLIDATPGSPGGKDDAPIVVGQTFSDFEAGIHLTTLAVNTDHDGRSVDVMVHLGTFPSNRPPVLSLAASATIVPTNTTVTFTATASDPDGDSLAYHWLCSDNTSASLAIIGSNAPSFTRSFKSNGKYLVTCIASDMKGGTATRHQLITVGTGGSVYSISGRITCGGQGLQGVHVSTGANNAVLTDSDGYFTIPSLGAGTHMVSPQLYGYTFTELFNNNVTLGPDFTGADFEAALTPQVTLTASVPTAYEAGPVPGRFTLTRTGPDTEALTVKIVPVFGSAATNDYVLNPAPTNGSPYSTVTIPAGQSSLDITVTPVNDASVEGPETVVMQLGLDAAYVISGPATATVVIEDNDTTLPKVSITAQTTPAVEAPLRTANFTISRTGSTASNLVVKLAYTGSASNGVDYVSLASSNIIPAGAASATVTVTPINDGVSEGFETVIASLATDGAYLKDPNASSATVLIVDDDQQVVSLEVTKNTAREVDLSLPGAVPDPGVFVVTRSGDVSQPLTIYYAVSGTALHGVDYEALPGFVTIPAGQTSASIVITPRFDSLGEPAETVSLQLAASNGNYKLGSVNNATITILDAGDLPTVEVLPWTNAKEPTTSGAFRFSLRGNTNATVTVNYTVSGTATPGVDYTALSGTISMSGTGAVTNVTVAVINDAVPEDLETVTVTITPNPNYQTWEPTRSATIWLYDDEQPTVFVDAHTLSSSGIYTPTMSEDGTGTHKFYLSRTGSTASDLTVYYTLSGTASNGVDYQLMSGVAVITNGWPGVDVPITPIQDAIFEGTETITLSLAPGAYSRGPDATIWLSDDETSGVKVGFAGSSSVAAESAGTINIPVVLSTTSAVPVTVEYGVWSGDIRNQMVGSINVPLPCWFRLTRTGDVFRAFYSTNGVAWSSLGVAETNAFNDPIWAGLAVCSCSDGILATGVFDNVSLVPDPGGVFEGRDVGYVSIPGSCSETGGVYTLTGSGDSLFLGKDEFHYAAQLVSGDFVLTARLISSSGGSNPYVGLMIREDLRNIARHLFMGQYGSNLTMWYNRKNAASTAQALGVDFQCPSGTLTFAPGTITNYIPITITDDTLVEPSEQVVLMLFNPNAAVMGNDQHVLTIADNDTAPLQPSVGFAATDSAVAESGTPVVRVVLSEPATNTVSVNYAVTGGTANSPDDYLLPPGTLSFVAGETVQMIPITLVDDSLVESNETVQITLSAPSGATLTTATNHILTITDNDLPVVTVVATDPAASETGDPGAWTFTRTGATTNDLLVNFTVAGTATSGSDYTPLGTAITIPTGSNSVTLAFSPLADTAVEGYETVIVRLTNSASYVIGSPGTGTVTIADANISTVSIAATVSNASETGPIPGVFTISRDGPTNNALTVYFSVTGTAAVGIDCGSIGTNVVIAAGQTSADRFVWPINDSLTEGTEYVVVSLLSNANYLVGSPSFASVAIADNDSPPTLFICQPAAKAVQLAAGNGLVLEAKATDDGAPEPLRFTWSQFSGPGTVTFGATNTAATTATFSTNGLYILRVSVTDGQFTVADDVTVQVGGFAPADWVDVSLGTPSRRGKSGLVNDTFTVLASGNGLSGTADSGHFVCRQVNGAASVVARVTGFTGAGTNALAGVMVRETNYRGARRALLGVRPNGIVEWRQRSARDGADTMTSGGTNALPLWVKLERSGDVITAYQAPDSGGSPGMWTPVGSSLTLTNLRADVDVGIAATAGTANTLTPVTFDHVALTPAPVGPAWIAEDLGNTSLVGTNYLMGSTNVIVGAGSIFTDTGRYLFQQYVGDVTITARILSHTASQQYAKGGVMIRDVSLDSAPYGMMGIAHYWGGYFYWRNVIGGSGGSSYGGSSVNPQWIRVVRKGNTIRAWKAPDSGSSPGTWTQQGATQLFSAEAPIYVGLAVDSGSYTATNVVQLDGVTIEVGNTAPVVDAGSGGIFTNASPLTIHATVTDDGQPNPPGATMYQWSQLSGPGTVTFGDTNALDTTATFSASGTYVLRLTADDGEVRVFDDVSYTVYHTPFEAWQAEHFGAESGGPDAAPTADPDCDGILNLMEYALKLDPNDADVRGLPVQGKTNVGGNDYLTLTYTRVKAATDITYVVEVSGDLVTWNSGPSYTATVSVTDNPDGVTQTVVVRDLVPMASATSRFIRLKVTQP